MGILFAFWCIYAVARLLGLGIIIRPSLCMPFQTVVKVAGQALFNEGSKIWINKQYSVRLTSLDFCIYLQPLCLCYLFIYALFKHIFSTLMVMEENVSYIICWNICQTAISCSGRCQAVPVSEGFHTYIVSFVIQTLLFPTPKHMFVSSISYILPLKL